MKEPQIIIPLTTKECAAFKRPINGQGGFQNLLKRLNKKIDPITKTITVSVSDVHYIRKYATKFGQGGFQDRLAPIMNACEMFSEI
jgi:hypothetical protein